MNKSVKVLTKLTIILFILAAVFLPISDWIHSNGGPDISMIVAVFGGLAIISFIGLIISLVISSTNKE